MRFFGHLLFVGAVAASPPACAATELCKTIAKFETDETVKAGRRPWIEFHWGFDTNPNVIWSWGCRYSSEIVASQTCKWLERNTNQEFAMKLPQDIMRCYGYRFPQSASLDWSAMAGAIMLRHRSGHDLLLEMSYRDLPNGENAMRLSVASDVALPPIERMPAVKAK
jgi:hypothetical protein